MKVLCKHDQEEYAKNYNYLHIFKHLLLYGAFIWVYMFFLLEDKKLKKSAVIKILKLKFKNA